MDTTNQEQANIEYAVIKLIESCAETAYGKVNVDPSPELRQVNAVYHIWVDGELICHFNVDGASVQIRIWSPYWNRHSRSKNFPEWTQFSLADPNNERIVSFLKSLRCDCENFPHKEH